jgi:uncharacterized protein
MRILGISRKRAVIKKHDLLIQDLPSSLQGLRIVQLSDLHHGRWISLEFIHKIIAQTNALNPDLILLTGDYIHDCMSQIEPVVRALGHLKPKIASIGVLGNHDWWQSGKKVRQAFRRVGIPFVDNDRLFISKRRRLVTQADSGLCIAGVGDLWEDEINIDAALDGVPADMPRILLSHNPDVAEHKALLEHRHRIDLMLSGHTHGGQVRIPKAVTPLLVGHRKKYLAGFAQGPICPVYISTGIGLSRIPFRLGVPPEIACFELRGI